jgi:hypothetical protein
MLCGVSGAFKSLGDVLGLMSCKRSLLDRAGACRLSVDESLWLPPSCRRRSSATPLRRFAIASRCDRREARFPLCFRQIALGQPHRLSLRVDTLISVTRLLCIARGCAVRQDCSPGSSSTPRRTRYPLPAAYVDQYECDFLATSTAAGKGGANIIKMTTFSFPTQPYKPALTDTRRPPKVHDRRSSGWRGRRVGVGSALATASTLHTPHRLALAGSDCLLLLRLDDCSPYDSESPFRRSNCLTTRRRDRLRNFPLCTEILPDDCSNLAQ